MGCSEQYLRTIPTIPERPKYSEMPKHLQRLLSAAFSESEIIVMRARRDFGLRSFGFGVTGF